MQTKQKYSKLVFQALLNCIAIGIASIILLILCLWIFIVDRERIGTFFLCLLFVNGIISLIASMRFFTIYQRRKVYEKRKEKEQKQNDSLVITNPK
ncbi:MAG: hypothetical protein A3C58_00625 [Candidatus Staskawiczbacteria bacterium RIFCSPHIGHO2_02_FULL_34_10]|uniref:Uncharacterized protein n=1 Tax=Candidatus Staskawiczbacteria bacterium RIFCSPHIGHO2_02_FULL_34_10 TaxID=1802205 RepID=A0A1G2HZ45_9BACT|nr:MAG: hypothetical protein A3C58_00625 [Candidatus Staskawiczbacteria bacterium RIFCSPHIGHO2_02_FULL_34_10]